MLEFSRETLHGTRTEVSSLEIRHKKVSLTFYKSQKLYFYILQISFICVCISHNTTHILHVNYAVYTIPSGVSGLSHRALRPQLGPNALHYAV